jgi:hypothetical protein
MEALKKALCEAPALRFCLLSLAVAIALLQLGWNWGRELTTALLCGMAACGALLWVLRHRALAYLCSVGTVALWWSMCWREALPVRIPHRLEPIPALLAGQIRQVLRDEPPVLRVLVEGELDAQALPPVQTRVLLHVFGTDGTEPWRTPGEFLRAHVRVRPPTPAQLPTDFPEWEYCAHLGAQWVATAHREGVALWAREGSWSASLSRWIAQQRQQVLHAIAQLYPEWLAGVMAALLCGDRSKLQPEERRAFALAGVAHVLAVSGLHVGILAAAISIALGFVPWQGLRWGIFCIALAAFVLLTGAQPSAVRAGITAAACVGNCSAPAPGHAAQPCCRRCLDDALVGPRSGVLQLLPALYDGDAGDCTPLRTAPAADSGAAPLDAGGNCAVERRQLGSLHGERTACCAALPDVLAAGDSAQPRRCAAVFAGDACGDFEPAGISASATLLPDSTPPPRKHACSRRWRAFTRRRSSPL